MSEGMGAQPHLHGTQPCAVLSIRASVLNPRVTVLGTGTQRCWAARLGPHGPGQISQLTRGCSARSRSGRSR